MILGISELLRKKLETVEDTTSIQEVAKKMKDSLVVVDTNGNFYNSFMEL